jgi:hypothetical protein
MFIQQSFDVNELPRPVELLETALAKLEIACSLLPGGVGSGDLVGSRQPQHFRRFR